MNFLSSLKEYNKKQNKKANENDIGNRISKNRQRSNRSF